MSKTRILTKSAKLSQELGVKPCPFCGGEARLKKHPKLEQTWYVQCKDCGIRTPNVSQCAFQPWKEARNHPITLWNSRVESVKE